MCIRDRGVLNAAGMELTVIQASLPKFHSRQTAHGKGTVVEAGEIAVGVVGQAVESYLVEIALLEEALGKARLCRPVIGQLIDDFEGLIRVQVHGLVLEMCIRDRYWTTVGK